MPNNEHRFLVVDPAVIEHANLQMTAYEAAFLGVARHFFETFTAPDRQCWMDAFLEAERAFPPPFGATIAHAICLVVEEMRRARKSVFSFFRNDDPIACTAMTREERYLVQVLRGIREGRRSFAHTQAMMLCDGRASDRFLAAVERLCVITGDVDPER